jgi:hypothetical protein
VAVAIVAICRLGPYAFPERRDAQNADTLEVTA